MRSVTWPRDGRRQAAAAIFELWPNVENGMLKEMESEQKADGSWQQNWEMFPSQSQPQ